MNVLLFAFVFWLFQITSNQLESECDFMKGKNMSNDAIRSFELCPSMRFK